MASNKRELHARFWSLNSSLETFHTRDERKAIQAEMKAIADQLDAIEDAEQQQASNEEEE